MEVKPGYKQTEVGVIPEDWKSEPLGNSTKLQGGYAFRSSAFSDSGMPVVRISNVQNGSIDIEGAICHPKVIIPSEFVIGEGAILMAMSGATTGKVGVYKYKQLAYQNQRVGRFVTRNSRVTSSKFISQLVRSDSFLNSLQVFLEQGAQPNISSSQVESLVFPIPSTKAEQETIAEALSDADALIESLEQLLAKKRQIKQGAMQDLLTGKKRLPGFRGDWGAKQLGDLARIQRGASPRPIDSPIWFDSNSDVCWARISDVTKSGMYLMETKQRLSSLGIERSRHIRRGSLIMSICATVGRPIITKIDACIHDGFVVFENLDVDKIFLYYILKWIEDDWSRGGQTGSQMNLNTELIKRTSIALPATCEEQTAIATILSDMDAEISTLETKLAKARQIKQGMMQELLTGRIRLV